MSPFDLPNYPERDRPKDSPASPVNLRHRRRRSGRSIRQMAAEVGVSEQCLRTAEAGGTPMPENQMRIAEAYGLDVVVQWPDPIDECDGE